jgi:hypothetical protein
MTRFIFSLIVFGLLSETAFAHQQKLAVTTIKVNNRTENVEIMHQVPVHDAEHAVGLFSDLSPDIVGSEESRKAFADYVASRFIFTVDEEVVSLSYVGSEIIGGSLWVYQETSLPTAGAALAVDSNILMDVWARQENRVNIGSVGDTRTLIFKDGDTLKPFTLAPPKDENSPNGL